VTTTFDPTLRADEIRAPSGQTPPADKNVASWPNGIVTCQCDIGDAPSSRSITGRRYGSGALPNTWSFP
jgi:hypothetical protein